jgi:hypothetical protein
VIAPLSADDYHTCGLLLRDLEGLIESAASPVLRRELGDLRARMRAAMDGYEATA